MNSQYIFRLDDICPTMDWRRFQQIRELFNTFHIKPIIGIIPDNQDKKLRVDLPRSDFWEIMRQLQADNWIIAQHGYQHVYRTTNPGILGINKRSEFAGRSYTQQYQAIAAGKTILQKNLGRAPSWWMAPAHSFDHTTCRVLQDLAFTHITDGIAIYPYQALGLTWLPQQLWQPRPMPFGTWTICLHPNTIKDTDMKRIENFIKQYHQACQNITMEPHPSMLTIPFRAAWYMYLYIQR